MEISKYNYQAIQIAILFSMILKIGQYHSFITFTDLCISSGMFFFSGKEKKVAQWYTIYMVLVFTFENVVKQTNLLN